MRSPEWLAAALTRLRARSPDPTRLPAGSLEPTTPSPSCPQRQLPAAPSLHSQFLRARLFWIPHLSIVQYLDSPTILLSLMPSRSTCPGKRQDSLLFYGYLYHPIFLICGSTDRSLGCSRVRGQRCDGHGGAGCLRESDVTILPCSHGWKPLKKSSTSHP